MDELDELSDLKPATSAASQLSEAFNFGSDARLNGLPIRANPYSPAEWEYRVWRNGWLDVENFWGILSRRPYRALPTVVN